MHHTPAKRHIGCGYGLPAYRREGGSHRRWWLRGGGFRREVQPRRQHWFLNEKSGFPFRTPAFCSVSRGQRRLGEKEYRAPSVTPGVALRPRTQETPIPGTYSFSKAPIERSGGELERGASFSRFIPTVSLSSYSA